MLRRGSTGFRREGRRLSLERLDVPLADLLLKSSLRGRLQRLQRQGKDRRGP